MRTIVITEDDARVIGENVGAATMAWTPKPTGTFDSELAAAYCKNIQDHVAGMLAKAYELGRQDEREGK